MATPSQISDLLKGKQVKFFFLNNKTVTIHYGTECKM